MHDFKLIKFLISFKCKVQFNGLFIISIQSFDTNDEIKLFDLDK